MSIFVPHNIESRKKKLKQINLKMLQSKVIEGSILVDEFFNFTADQVNVRAIIGDVGLSIDLGYIPEWLKNVTINGNFDISYCELSSLENCPKYISGHFNGYYSSISSLEGGPEYVGGDFKVTDNLLTNLLGAPKHIGRDFNCGRNQLLSLDNNIEFIGRDVWLQYNKGIRITEQIVYQNFKILEQNNNTIYV